MSRNSWGVLDRARKAIEYRNLDPANLDLTKLFDLAERRGATGNDLNSWLHRLIGWIEPPGCTMGHCENAGGVGSFCRCALGRVPGRCKIHRDYKRRVAERTKRATSRVLEVMGDGAIYDAESIRVALGCNRPENIDIGGLLRSLEADDLVYSGVHPENQYERQYVIAGAGR